jgi:hypothetical protein
LLIARTTTSAPTTTTNPSSDFASQDPLRTIANAGGSTDELLRTQPDRRRLHMTVRRRYELLDAANLRTPIAGRNKRFREEA